MTANLPLFYEAVKSSRFPIRFSWKNQVANFFSANRDKIYTRYEDLLRNPYAELIYLLNHLNIEPDISLIKDAIELYSFKNQKKQTSNAGQMSSHLRKGISGDWVNHFTSSLSQRILNDLGNEMSLLGYE